MSSRRKRARSTPSDTLFGREADGADGKALAEAFPPLPPLPDTSRWPVLAVHLDPRSETLAFRLPGSKRWRGKFASMEALMPAAFAHGLKSPSLISFVEKRT